MVLKFFLKPLKTCINPDNLHLISNKKFIQTYITRLNAKSLH